MTHSTTAADALAAASAVLVQSYDVVDAVTRMLVDAVAVSGATSGGVILRRRDQNYLNLLAATSHQAQELELYQAQVEQGPCVEAVQTGRSVRASGADFAQRWPQIAAAFQRAGLVRAHATPLLWQGTVIGALNVFWSRDAVAAASDEASPADEELQAIADMITLAIVHAAPLSSEIVSQRVREALAERTLVEQVKGVLAHQQGITPEQAYEVLLSIAHAESETVQAMAARLLADAERP